MALLFCAVVIALLVGWLTGGRLGGLANVPLRGWPLMIGAAVASGVGVVVGDAADGTVAVVATVAAAALLIVLVVRNAAVEGIPLLAAGLLLNAIVVGANGAMPVSLDAAAAAGVATGPFATGDDARHVLAGPTTRLDRLGDVIAVPLPHYPEVVSPGDVLVVAGVALLVVAGMRRQPAMYDG
jgi:uncharacterized protein DUF5317